MTRRGMAALLLAGGVVQLVACAPTVRVKVEPITIYAKLDADVRIRLDEDVRRLIQANPELF